MTLSLPPPERSLGVSPGEVIGGRYELVRVLGVGGTGAVFEARHRTIQRTVAVKLLLPEIAHSNPAIPARFLQEARTANEVRHKNIVEVIDFGNDDGRLFMVMEFLDGESLGALLKREAPVAPSTIVRLLDPILGALALAHSRGIVHRDVKPANIFLARTPGEDGPTPKLIDFGIAKRVLTDDVSLTATGMILGTPAYMAPEQASGSSRAITAAADQYALGAILYEALTGVVPHQADSYPAMLVAIVTTPARDIRLLRPDLDAGFAAVIMRTLHPEPSHRYGSLYDLREALAPYRDLGGRPPGMRPSAEAPFTHLQTRPDGTPPADDDRPTTVTPRATPAAPSPAVAAMPAAQPIPSFVPAQTVTAQMPAQPPSSAGALPWVAGVVGVLAVGMVGFAASLAMHPRPRPTAPAPVVVPAAPRATDGESVTFRIDVDPPNASITLDGALVGQGHAEVLRPRDGRRYQLRLSAPGRANVSDVLVASADARVSRVLAPMIALPTAPPSTPRSPSVSPPPSAPSPPPPAPHPPGDRRHPVIDRNNPFQ